MSENIERSVERSSLGTRSAVAARKTVTTTAASKVVERSEKNGPGNTKKAGG